MKSIKFKPHLVEQILSGAKTITWRFFDDKNLEIGDLFKCIQSDTLEEFAEGEIVRIEEKAIKDLSPEDLETNNYESIDHVVSLNKTYYGDAVTLDTIAKMIHFKLRNKSLS